MTIDRRTRFYKDIREISHDEVFDSLLPCCIEENGALAGRGLAYKKLPALALEEAGRSVTLFERGGSLCMEDGTARADAIASLSSGALSELVQDQRTTMGLAMNSQVTIQRGTLDDFIGWESVFRALFDARPVYEAGGVTFRDRNGDTLDLDRTFTLDDDKSEVSHFLHEAGFLHVANVFTEEEMATVAHDIDVALEAAEPDDGLSWWAGDSTGKQIPVRILSFHERSPALRSLLADDRLTWIGKLTDDGHVPPAAAEGLIKPLDIQTGLSDLPWHKDCGQGSHSYMCNSMTIGISVTGADERSGALGVLPGSHRASLQSAGLDPSFDIEPRKLPTKTGDLTVHCSDTFHRAYRPTQSPRKVVYTGFRQPKRSGDVIPKIPTSRLKADRARLTDVRDRIAASDPDGPQR